jgi:hypothetical protein
VSANQAANPPVAEDVAFDNNYLLELRDMCHKSHEEAREVVEHYAAVVADLAVLYSAYCVAPDKAADENNAKKSSAPGAVNHAPVGKKSYGTSSSEPDIDSILNS